MTTMFSARNSLDNIRFYVDPRSIEYSRSRRMEERTLLVSGIHHVDDSAGLPMNGVISRSIHFARTTIDKRQTS
jgi:hypothetical protein